MFVERILQVLTADDVHTKLDELIVQHASDWASLGADVQNDAKSAILDGLMEYLELHNSDASIEDDGSGYMITILDSDTGNMFEIKRAYDGGKLEIDK